MCSCLIQNFFRRVKPLSSEAQGAQRAQVAGGRRVAGRWLAGGWLVASERLVSRPPPLRVSPATKEATRTQKELDTKSEMLLVHGKTPNFASILLAKY